MKWILIAVLAAFLVSCGQQVTGTTQIKVVATDTYVDSNNDIAYRVYYIHASNASDEIRQADIRDVLTTKEIYDDFEKNIGAIYAVSIVSQPFTFPHITAARLLQEPLKGR